MHAEDNAIAHGALKIGDSPGVGGGHGGVVIKDLRPGANGSISTRST
jgi:hypothetical protein